MVCNQILSRLFVTLIGLFLPGLVFGQVTSESIVYHIKKQLYCVENPEPIFTFIALENVGKIDRNEMVGFDSISCFRIKGGLEIDGMNFVSVCGHSEDPLIRELFPQFIWRGPGTSPGQFVSFGTGANFETVAKWYLEKLNRKFLNQAIETENTTFGDATEVTCSSWMH